MLKVYFVTFLALCCLPKALSVENRNLSKTPPEIASNLIQHNILRSQHNYARQEYTRSYEHITMAREELSNLPEDHQKWPLYYYKINIRLYCLWLKRDSGLNDDVKNCIKKNIGGDAPSLFINYYLQKYDLFFALKNEPPEDEVRDILRLLSHLPYQWLRNKSTPEERLLSSHTNRCIGYILASTKHKQIYNPAQAIDHLAVALACQELHQNDVHEIKKFIEDIETLKK